MVVDVKFRDVKTGICSLSGKEGEVFEAELADGTVKGSLSLKAIAQLLRMKLVQFPKLARGQDSVPSNGTGE